MAKKSGKKTGNKVSAVDKKQPNKGPKKKNK